MQGFKTILVAILSLAGVVAAKYGFDFPVDDQAVAATAIMTVVMTFMRIITKGPVKLPGSGELNSSVLVTALAVAVLCLGGCAQLKQKAESGDLTISIAVQVATLRYVENSAGGVDVDKLNRVYDHAVAIRAYLDRDVALSIDDLEGYINSRIDYTQLSISEQVAARAFIEVLSDYLRAKADQLENTNDNIRDGKVVAYYIVGLVIDTLEPYHG
jgi:hypothetical protein